jgi:hypothetical protein
MIRSTTSSLSRCSSLLWIVSCKDLPVDDLKGLIAGLKANPDKGNCRHRRHR